MKTSLIISTVVYFLTLIQSQDLPNNSITVKIPENAKKLVKSEASTYIKKNFKGENYINAKKNIYKIKNVVLAYDDYILPKGETKTLIQIKGEMEGMMGELNLKNDIVKSEITQINNRQYFVWQTLSNDEYLYTVISDPKYKKAIIAKILFKKSDKKTADRILSDFMQNIAFKK
ncbi:hypothetical protein [Pedobacter borealis]|uniref:hypothetical protein n=1 Tax=Pedobacter borealis TaxID=475254 RepID=UPI0012FC0F04|nr:hypothetical protein [Pedobacter borealis]